CWWPGSMAPGTTLLPSSRASEDHAVCQARFSRGYLEAVPVIGARQDDTSCRSRVKRFGGTDHVQQLVPGGTYLQLPSPTASDGGTLTPFFGRGTSGRWGPPER